MTARTEAAGVAGAGGEFIRTDDMLREQARAWREVFDLLCELRPGWYQGDGSTTARALATIRSLATRQARLLAADELLEAAGHVALWMNDCPVRVGLRDALAAYDKAGTT